MHAVMEGTGSLQGLKSAEVYNQTVLKMKWCRELLADVQWSSNNKKGHFWRGLLNVTLSFRVGMNVTCLSHMLAKPLQWLL